MAIEPGRTLAHYRLIAQIGKGGMGVVWRALDTTLGRQIALKILPEAFAADPERLARFRREATALAALNHPGIVAIHSIEEADGVRFLTMELAAGRPLSAVIPRRGLELATILDIATPLAAALAAAHGKGVIHRDLKPANVMVADDGQVKVLDFGIAKLVDTGAGGDLAETATRSVTVAGSVLGTAHYMSPEQIQGKPVDARSDVFSLGVVLYEMATGGQPFHGETWSDLMPAILRDPAPPVTDARHDLPASLARVVRRCLEKDPARRYQSALDVRNDLDEIRVEQGTAPAGRRPVVPAPGTRARVRRVAMVAASVVVVTALAVLAWLGLHGRPGGTPAAPAIRSLAVLPLENLMGDPSQAYFVEGMHDALITELARLGTIKVISRTSVMGYAKLDPKASLPEIARELNVDGLVEGSVLRVGDRVRINVQLVDGRTDQHLWAQAYERDLRDAMGMIGEVTGAIAGQIKATLTPQLATRLAAAHRIDPKAQDLYLRGSQQLERFTGDAITLATEYFQQAIAVDPDYAAAYAGLAVCYEYPGIFGAAPQRDVMEQARSAALKAIELDDEVSEGHTALGIVKLYADWDWKGGEREFRRALELNSTDWIAYRGLSDYFVVTGDYEQALAEIRRGHEADPFSPVTEVSVVSRLIFIRRYDEAETEIRGFLQRHPDYSGLRNILARVLWLRGRQGASLALMRELWTGRPDLLQAADDGAARGGARGSMAAVARVHADRARTQYVNPTGVAEEFAMALDADQAMAWLERAYTDRGGFLVYVEAAPEYDFLRGDPRYQDLVRRIGFPPR